MMEEMITALNYDERCTFVIACDTDILTLLYMYEKHVPWDNNMKCIHLISHDTFFAVAMRKTLSLQWFRDTKRIIRNRQSKDRVLSIFLCATFSVARLSWFTVGVLLRLFHIVTRRFSHCNGEKSVMWDEMDAFHIVVSWNMFLIHVQ
jgi:hypothetical protein